MNEQKDTDMQDRIMIIHTESLIQAHKQMHTSSPPGKSLQFSQAIHMTQYQVHS